MNFPVKVLRARVKRHEEKESQQCQSRTLSIFQPLHIPFSLYPWPGSFHPILELLYRAAYANSRLVDKTDTKRSSSKSQESIKSAAEKRDCGHSSSLYQQDSQQIIWLRKGPQPHLSACFCKNTLRHS